MSEEALCIRVTRNRGDKGERKVGAKRKGMGTKRNQEGQRGRESWRYTEIFRPLLLSEIQQRYPRNLLPRELHSLASPVSTQELGCTTGGRKAPAFPRVATLKKAAVLFSEAIEHEQMDLKAQKIARTPTD